MQSGACQGRGSFAWTEPWRMRRIPQLWVAGTENGPPKQRHECVEVQVGFRELNHVEFKTIKEKGLNEQRYLCSSCVMCSFPSKNTFKVLFMLCLSFIVLLLYFHRLDSLDFHCVEPVPFKVGIEFKEFHSIRPHRENFTYATKSYNEKLRRKLERANVLGVAYTG